MRVKYDLFESVFQMRFKLMHFANELKTTYFAEQKAYSKNTKANFTKYRIDISELVLFIGYAYKTFSCCIPIRSS